MTMVLTACGSASPSQRSSVSTASTESVSDVAIAQALYDNRRIPDGFYREKTDTERFYSVRHLRNADLQAANSTSALSREELAAESFDQALAWSDAAASYQAASLQLVDTRFHELYYQFTLVDPASPQFVTVYRVFRHDVLDRTGVSDNYWGRVTAENISARQLADIIEYLWIFTDDNNYGNAVISSITTENPLQFQHEMIQAKLNGNIAGNCDTVEVYRIAFRVAKDSGFIRRQKQLLRVFRVHRETGSVALCR